ncbi:MAG: hypothetical protein R6U86_08080 [Bacteroidales bacterium]
MIDKDIFDKEFRQRFEGFEPEPPADAWSAIEQGLVVSSSRILAPWVYRVAAAVAVLAVTGFSFLYFSSRDYQVQTVSEQGPHDGVSEAGAETPDVVAEVPVFSGAEAVADDVKAPVKGLASKTSGLPGQAQQAITFQPPVQASHFNLLADAAVPIGSISASLAFPGQPALQGSVRSTGAGSSQTDLAGFFPASTGGRFSLGAFFGPQYNDRHIGNPGGLTSSVPFSSLEEKALTYSYGLSGSYRISKRMVVQTGATYLNVAQVVNNINALAHPDGRQFYDPADLPPFGHPQNISTSLGTITLDDPTLFFMDMGSSRIEMTTKWPLDIPEPKTLETLGYGLTQRFSFVEVPLILRYTLFERRMGLHLKAGMAANFLVNNEVFLVSDHYNGAIGQTAGLREQYFSGIGGLVLTIPLSPRFQLFVEPTGQVFLNPMVRDELTASIGKTFPYNFSVYSGLSFRF